MRNSKENLIEELRKKQREAEEQKQHHAAYNKKILSELPQEVGKIMDRFSAMCETPLVVNSKMENVTLKWAYNNEKIGEVNVKQIDITFQDRILKLKLESDVGYVGATAKVNAETNNPKAEKKWPIHKGGIFIKIGYKEREENSINYLDKNYSIQPLTDDIILEILRAVFLEKE